LPNADVKIYLDASPDARAARRAGELERLGRPRGISLVLAEINARDKNDMGREHSPLRPADDAVIIDTSDMTLNETVDIIGNIISRTMRGERL
jgi:cytidylate kinase